ncbi:hypothetical protein PM082_007281 [Marasmius tenuissimus]|nr:hypothetical protein PM082_007281 [Marasmius tenuissimus]
MDNELSPLPLSYLVLFGIGYLAIISLPDFRLIRTFSLFGLTLIDISIFLHKTTGNPGLDYGIASLLFAWTLNAFSWTLLDDIPSRADPKQIPAGASRLSTRVQEGIALVTALRGIGWSHEPKICLQSRPDACMTRTRFVVQKLANTVIYSVVTIFASLYTRNQPCFSFGGPSAGDQMFGITGRVLNVAAFGASAVTALAMLYDVTTATLVSLGVTTPQLCPPLFGSPSHAFTLRRFWGKFWHQLLRPVVLPYAKFVPRRVLRLKEGSLPYHLVSCLTAFIITGVLHEVSDSMTRKDRKLTVGSSLVFFSLQPIGIALESLVIHFGQNTFGLAERDGSRKPGPNFLWKVAGYIWVACWFVWCGPLFIAAIVKGQFMN